MSKVVTVAPPRSSPYPTTPPKEETERFLNAAEVSCFSALGYPLDTIPHKVYKSNAGKWFLGTARNEFACFVDDPIAFGFIRLKTGGLMAKADMKSKVDPEKEILLTRILGLETIRDQHREDIGQLQQDILSLKRDIEELQKVDFTKVTF